jgi:hypothetical protein
LNGKVSGIKLRMIGRILEVVWLKYLYIAEAITVENLMAKMGKNLKNN